LKAEKDFYLSDVREISRALYRNGNASTVRFTSQEGSIRPQDAKLQTDPSTGIVYVLPSHAGVSASEVFDGGINRWKIRAGTQVPIGLALAVDRLVPGHVHIVATRRMKMSEYIALLETMFEQAAKVTNIQAELVQNKASLQGRRA